MKERTPSRSPRRALLIRVGLVVLLAIGSACTRDDDAPVRSKAAGDGETPNDGDVATPVAPVFRFTRATRELVRTSPGRVGRRHREASVRAAAEARDVLTDLYAEGFLDPTNWQQGLYDEAFTGFAGGARQRAEARPGLLTAGSRAGDRYEEILPVSSRIATRILLDRAGKPTLLVSIVRFSAAAFGPEPRTLRSNGQFFFERAGRSWKIVSFDVIRTDAPREAA